MNFVGKFFVIQSYDVKYSYGGTNYSHFPKSDVLTQASKILEDRVLYNKVNNWSEIIRYFDKVYEGELNLGIKSNDVKKWHQLLQVYFANKPEDKDIVSFTTGMGFPPERAQEIVTVIEGSDVENAKGVILGFYNNFEKLLLKV